jgi:phage terminase large subunit-like protein
VHHVGVLPALEDHLISSFTTNGYMGDGSSDRTDALIWGLTELFPRVVADRAPFAQVKVIGPRPLMRYRRWSGQS